MNIEKDQIDEIIGALLCKVYRDTGLSDIPLSDLNTFTRLLKSYHLELLEDYKNG